MTLDKREEGVGYSPTRRRFLEIFCLGLGGAAATAVAIPFIGFLLAPLFAKTAEAWRSVGSVNSFKIGQTVEVSFTDASPLPWAGLTSNWPPTYVGTARRNSPPFRSTVNILAVRCAG